MAGIHFDTSEFDRRHQKNQRRRQKKLQSLYEAFYREAARAGSATGFSDPGREFRLKDYPQAQKQMKALLEGLCGDITANIEEGSGEAFDTSAAKNEALIAAAGASAPLPGTLLPEVRKRCESARSAFQGRRVAGMGLSERVWSLGQNVLPQIEMALEIGLSEGKSAAALSRDVRSYLNEPEKLFRRVRDRDGILRLSKAAGAYHPGQGVYRSSYKNALRLTVTETNAAYRTADHAQWNAMPFVTGVEVNLSGNHPVADICDELKGTYPKEFRFTGWHPFCRCFATPKLCSREELNRWARMSDEERAAYRFKGEVRSVPKNFTDWVDKNRERIGRAKSLPYFIKDNIPVIGNNSIGGKTSIFNFSPTLRNVHPLNDYKIQPTEAITKNTQAIADKLNIAASDPMIFKLADSGHVNPRYSWWDKLMEEGGYENNCVVTADVLELRLRGIDVMAGAAIEKNKFIWEKYITGDLASIWIDPETKLKPTPKFINAKTREGMVEKLESDMVEGGRYKIAARFKDGSGHAFSAFKDKDGNIFYYDSQSNEIDYVSWKRILSTKKDLQVLRIDDKIVDLELVSKILRKG